MLVIDCVRCYIYYRALVGRYKMGCYKQRVKLLVIRKEGTTASLPKVYSVVSEPGVVKMKAFRILTCITCVCQL